MNFLIEIQDYRLFGLTNFYMFMPPLFSSLKKTQTGSQGYSAMPSIASFHCSQQYQHHRKCVITEKIFMTVLFLSIRYSTLEIYYQIPVV